VSAEKLAEIQGALLDAGSPHIVKVRTTAPLASPDADVEYVLRRGAYVASYRVMWGTAADLERLVSAAGFTVRGSYGNEFSVAVVFDVPA